MNTVDFLETLRDRGFMKLVSDEEGLRAALAQPITLYCGYDPTADSLTAGHLLSVMLLRHAQQAGHRCICLVGGATGMVGDPTGKSASRPALALEQVRQNMAGQRAQLERMLDFSDGRALMLNNADWLGQFNLLAFLRQVGMHFSIAPMLAAETYESRLSSGLTFTEFSYMLLQAYDFLHLYQEYQCVLQVGGSDQWANSLAGADLIRRVTGGSAYVLVTPLLTTASGAKMGKTAEGAVWLDPERTTPYQFYQYWINTEDADVERFLALFTYLPMAEVRRLGSLSGAELREAKAILAFEITSLVHGKDAAISARAASQALFGGGDLGDVDVPTVTLDPALLASGLTIVDVLTLSTLSASRSEARRLIAQGAAMVNDDRVQAPDQAITKEHFVAGHLLLRAGKKRYCRVVLSDS